VSPHDVSSSHVNATSCGLQPCRSSNVPKTRVFGLLRPLPGDFRSNHASCGPLSVKWGHVTWFPVTGVTPPPSYSPLELKRTQNTSFRTSIVTSRWLPVKWHHFWVTCGHVRSRDFISCHVNATCELQNCRSSKCTKQEFSALTATFKWLPLKWRHFRVTSGHVRSRYIISSLVDATSCELQPCRTSNIHKTWVFCLLQPLPGDFWSNVTIGSLPVTWDHMTSFSVTWMLPPASCCCAGAQTYTKREFLAFYSNFQVTSGKMTSLPGHFRSREGSWHHFLSRDCNLLRVTDL